MTRKIIKIGNEKVERKTEIDDTYTSTHAYTHTEGGGGMLSKL